MKCKNRVIGIVLCLTMIAGLIFPTANVGAEDTDFGEGPIIVKNTEGTYDVTFRYKDESGSASEVQLKGEIQGDPEVTWGGVSMKETTDGSDIWSIIIRNVEPGEYKYKFYLPDTDQWIADPANNENLDGDGNSIIKVGDDIESGDDNEEGDDFTHVSPEVHGKEVTFRYSDASAESVHLIGEMNDWGWKDDALKLTKGKDGIWELTIELPVGVYGYKFIVYKDGKDEWKNDQVNEETIGDDNNNKVVVPGLEDGTLNVMKEEEADLPELCLYTEDGNSEMVKPSYSLKDESLSDYVTISGEKITVSDECEADNFVLVADYQDYTSEVAVSIVAAYLEDAKFDDILEVAIDDGEKSLMSPYYSGMFEGEVDVPSGRSTYRIYLNGELARIGYIESDSDGKAWVRYWSFQDEVITSCDDSDGFKYPATWVGKFSTVPELKVLNLDDWAPADSDGDLEYKGGGVFQKTFNFDKMEEATELKNDDDPGYKIAFGGDWNHGSVGLNGGNKPLTFPAGSETITLWVNSLTSETYDSINDGSNVTLDTVKISIDGNNYDMIQNGFHTFMKTVLLESGEHSWTYATEGIQSLADNSITLSERTAVTFWYNAEDSSTFNSKDDLEELEGLTNWIDTINANYPLYDGDDLGAEYTPSGTTFKVWAPSASKVMLNRYESGDGDDLIGTLEMTKDETDETWNGVWTITVNGDLKGTYYTYSVTAGGATKETNDVYAKAAGLNGDRGMVVDLDSTDPVGWDKDAHVMVDEPTDAIVWEVNVSDFSSDASSGMDNRGKYLAFTETGTTLNSEGELSTGIDYLKELGVNYVQLLPVFDFVNDETSGNYNWGYAPLNYNVPEGSFSTDPSDGNVRITEFKQMVQALHDNGIGVVIDVVYNHVGGDGKESWFNRTVPGYYFRQDKWGNFMDSGTACGNETASEAEMFRKYMIDSVVYWAEEYHIDGFRFDLMGCHDVDTMNAIRDALDDLEDGEKILMYGEPWAAGTTNQPEGVEMVDKSSEHNTIVSLDERIGAFSNNMRDSLKGEQWQDEEGFNKGFVQGSQKIGEKSANVKLIGSIQANSNLDADEPWALQPSQVVSYVSVHDDLSLYDKLQRSVNGVVGEKNPEYYEKDPNLVRMNKMAAAVLATSQGMMFFQAGEEMARSKGGDHNSYESPLSFTESGVEYELNAINWERSEKFSDLVEYYKGLLELRKAYAPFTASDMSTVNNMTFSDGNENLIAYTINSPEEEWKMVAVLMNSNTEAQDVTLQVADGVELPASWNCVVDQDSAGVETLGTYEGTTITVPAQTVLVLVAADEDDFKDEPKDEPKDDPKDEPKGEQSGYDGWAGMSAEQKAHLMQESLAQNAAVTAPKTNDNAPIAMVIMLLATGAVAVAGAVGKKRKLG